MGADTEVVIDEALLGEEETGPFDWEDHLYESWREEKREREARTENPDK